jgi:alcohol dehydrogenase
LGVDATAYSAALRMLDARTFPFEDLDCRVAGFDDAAALLRDMAGEGGPPPVRGAIVPDAT